MDDIYFSDKDKKRNRADNEPHSSKRRVSDKFLDSDYDNEVFELGGFNQFFAIKNLHLKLHIESPFLFIYIIGNNFYL